MTTYYVAAAGGNNGNDGLSAGAALATLEYALNTKAAAGDTIILLDGTHDDANGFVLTEKPASTITIRAANAGQAELTASGGGGYVVLFSGQKITFEGIVFTGGANTYTFWINAADVTDLTFTNCTFTNDVASGACFYIGAKNTSNLTFTGCTITSTNTAKGLYLIGLQTDHAENFAFDTCTITAATGNAVDAKEYIDGLTFTDCTITGNATAFTVTGNISGLTISGGSITSDTVGVTGLSLVGATLSDITLSGVTVTGELVGAKIGGTSSASCVDTLRITDCGITCTNAGDASAARGLWITHANDITISGTHCTGADYGTLIQGKINNLAVASTVFSCTTAIGAWIGGVDADAPLSGIVTLTDVVAEGSAAAAKGFAFGESIIGATITVTRLVAKCADGGITFRVCNNTTTVTTPWTAATTLNVYDSFIFGQTVIGTGHSHVQITNTTMCSLSTSPALTVRRGIEGATVTIRDCLLSHCGTDVGHQLVYLAGTRNCRIANCQLVGAGYNSTLIQADVNAVGETVEGFRVENCWLFVPTGGDVYNLASAKLSASPSIYVNGSHILNLSSSSDFGTIFGTSNITTLAAVRTAWDGNEATAGNDAVSDAVGKRGQFGYFARRNNMPVLMVP